MEYVFGYLKIKGNLEQVLKTVGESPSNLSGNNQIQRKYSDSIITDEFKVREKYLSKVDTEGRCYDWYIIDDHSRYIDYFTPLKEQIKTDITDSQNALCDLSADLEEMLVDIENALCELTEE